MAGEVFKNTVHVQNPETGEAQWFHPGDVAPDWTEGLVDPNNFTDGVPFEEAQPEAVNYGKLNKTELQELAADRGLDTEGTRQELIERLQAHDDAVG